MSSQPSPWQQLSTNHKVVFLIYYFFICIVPIVSILFLVDLSPLLEFSEGLSGFIGVGLLLLFPVITFSLLQERVTLLIQHPFRFFSPFFIQGCFLAYSFFFEREVAIHTLIISALSEFCGLFLILTTLIISFIYKKRLARKEGVADKLVKLGLGLFITLFFWIPLFAYGYAYLSSMASFPTHLAYVGIVQFFIGVITVALSQKEMIKQVDAHK